MSVLVVQHLVTLSEATKIMQLFKQKKHSGHGYFFELTDLGAPTQDALKLPGLEPYGRRGSIRHPADARMKENAYILRVHRELRPKLGALLEQNSSQPAPEAAEPFTADEIRVIKKYAQFLLEAEARNGVSLD